MRYRQSIPFLAVMLSVNVLASSISGHVSNEQGDSLSRVRVCLQSATDDSNQCIKSDYTNKNGFYLFNGVRHEKDYRVKVYFDPSLNGRKANLFPNYIWIPQQHDVSLVSRKENIDNLNFIGTFNFSNFQSEFQLDSSNFPEFANYNFSYDYVFLKVYLIDSNTSEQHVIFLGQVSNPDNLLIEASVPLAEQQLLYEIYSLNNIQPFTGKISLAN